MSTQHLNKLEDLIFLGPNKTIVDQKVKPLTQPGENYGSIMLALDVIIETPNGNEEKHFVAKTVPHNIYIQEIFNTQVTFRNEIGFYQDIVPILQNFQKEQGMDRVIDCFPKYRGSRINLTGDPHKVDRNGVIILDNLKYEDYVTLDQTKGFDLETTKMVLTDLAHLHAVPLGLKQLKPEIFEKFVKKYLATTPAKHDKLFFNKLTEVIGNIKGCEPYVPKIQEAFCKLVQKMEPPSETFATICHTDLWVNNVMIKTENGRSISSKLVDFQVCDYASPARDLVFFMFTSVQKHVLENNYDSLVEHYFITFTSTLQQLKCDTSEITFDAFLQEITHAAKRSEIAHVLFMLIPIFAEKEMVQDMSDFSPDVLLKMTEGVTDSCKQKLGFVVKEFAKRNWL